MPRWSAERRAAAALAAATPPRRARNRACRARHGGSRLSALHPLGFCRAVQPHNSDNTLPRERRSSPRWIDTQNNAFDEDQLTPLQAADLAFEREEARRDFNTLFVFHRFCPNKRCRRNRRCSGSDPAYCHTIFWPVVPEEKKAWWRAILQSRRTGRTLTQALRVAEAAQADARLRANAMAKLAKSASVASHK